MVKHGRQLDRQKLGKARLVTIAAGLMMTGKPGRPKEWLDKAYADPGHDSDSTGGYRLPEFPP